MSARPGRDSRPRYPVLRPAWPAALVVLLGTGAVLPAQGGPIRPPWAVTAASRPMAIRSPVLPRLSRSAAAIRPAPASSAATTATGGPFADYFRWTLRTQTTRVVVPTALRELQPASDGRLPDWAFVDYLRWRRSLNPARFDFYHPRIGLVLRNEPPVVPIQPDEPPVRPQTQRPPAPPQVPEPSSALVVVGLFGASWWACRRGQHQGPVGAANRRDGVY